jgi:hypothetical protein
LQRPTEHVGTAFEALFPHALANDRDRRRVATMIGTLKHAAENRLHAEQLEIRPVNDLGVDQFGLAGAVDDEAIRQPGRHAVVQLRLIAPVEIIGKRCTATLDLLALHVAPDLNKTFGVGIRQRPQDDGVDQSEDGGGRADAEREREHRADGRCRVLPDGTPRVSQIRSHGHLVPARAASGVPRFS